MLFVIASNSMPDLFSTVVRNEDDQMQVQIVEVVKVDPQTWVASWRDRGCTSGAGAEK